MGFIDKAMTTAVYTVIRDNEAIRELIKDIADERIKKLEKKKQKEDKENGTGTNNIGDAGIN